MNANTRYRRPVHRSLVRAACGAALCLQAPTVFAQGTRCPVIDLAGQPAAASSARVSNDGRYVVFVSNAQLTTTPTGGQAHVYRVDMLLGTTELVTLNAAGSGAASGGGANPWISGQGRFVVFESISDQLTAGGGSPQTSTDIYLRDMNLTVGAHQLVSQVSGLPQSAPGASDGECLRPTVSLDGRWVAFNSFATNLDPVHPVPPPPAQPVKRVFLRDVLQGTTLSISNNTWHEEVAEWPQVSDNGGCVVYQMGGRPAPGAGSYFSQILRYALSSGTTTLVSGGLWNPPQTCGRPCVSADGLRIAFTELANYGPGASTAWVRDIDPASGLPLPTNLWFAPVMGGLSLSGDGMALAYIENVPTQRLFVVDLPGLQTDQPLVDLAGQSLGGASPMFSLGGSRRLVAFESTAVHEPGGVGGIATVHIRDRGSVGTPYCFGDGSGTACPCGNTGFPLNGCANSSTVQGGFLSALGSPSLIADAVSPSLALTTALTPNTSCIFVQGSLRANGGAGVALADGLRGIAGSLVRLGTKSTVLGSARYPAPGDLPLSQRGGVLVPGTRTYQVWYRDTAAYCTAETYNLTNAIELVWTP